MLTKMINLIDYVMAIKDRESKDDPGGVIAIEVPQSSIIAVYCISMGMHSFLTSGSCELFSRFEYFFTLGTQQIVT